MHFKLILAFVEDTKTNDIMHAAREAGATGCTVINNARGEGIEEQKTFFGLTLATQRDVARPRFATTVRRRSGIGRALNGPAARAEPESARHEACELSRRGVTRRRAIANPRGDHRAVPRPA